MFINILCGQMQLETSLNFYTTILDSFNKVNLYYRDSYNVEVITKYKDEYEKVIL